VPLRITAVRPERDGPALPFVYDIAMAVRRGDRELHEALDRVLERRQSEIRDILTRYGVPLVDMEHRL
jgi:mxaJ protein